MCPYPLFPPVSFIPHCVVNLAIETLETFSPVLWGDLLRIRNKIFYASSGYQQDSNKALFSPWKRKQIVANIPCSSEAVVNTLEYISRNQVVTYSYKCLGCIVCFEKLLRASFFGIADHCDHATCGFGLPISPTCSVIISRLSDGYLDILSSSYPFLFRRHVTFYFLVSIQRIVLFYSDISDQST